MNHKYRVCVVTSTRAEYGLLAPVIKELRQEESICVDIVATGMHMEEKYGNTYKEIEADGNTIFRRIPIMESGNTSADISRTMANAISAFAVFFHENSYDLLVVLGDRYEMLAVCIAAVNEHIPIAHLNGGDTTEGALDECYRHSMTKMSYLHFTSTEQARNRVIQLGESPDRVFCVGATGVENAIKTPLRSLADLGKSIGFDLSGRYAVVTFHPVTQENGTAQNQITQLLGALSEYSDMKFIITKSNSDAGSEEINNCLEQYASDHDNVYLTASLGMLNYLSALKYASAVIGNSSSGIMEAPSFGIPTINIGDRQKGRVQGNTIINCLPTKRDIVEAIKMALSETMQQECKKCDNPYYRENTSEQIAQIIKEFLMENKINLKKQFYDMENIEFRLSI